MSRTAARLTIAATLCLLAAVPAAGAAMKEVQHPFILWTREDAAAIRKRIETQAWAKKAYEELQKPGPGEAFNNLFRYSVMGEQAPADKEKAYLLSFIGANVDPRPWSDNYLTALRYDVLHALLTPEQRQQIEDTFREHMRFEVEEKRVYTRTNWLPNMMWCRKMSAALMAVAMKDEQAIRAMFGAPGGWKYYLDAYVSDGRFYNEEFGKQTSMNGEMLLWCRGLERLGLDELGYGYTGKGGATMKNYIESYLRLGMPLVELGATRPQYPHVTMGDAKGGRRGFLAYGLQQCLVNGYGADGSGGESTWYGSNMNGRDHKDRIIDKMHRPQWFEIAHQKWPELGFGYFLAQMRAPDQDRYFPTLYWGLEPLDPATVKPPAAPSGAYPERGIAVLRADESQTYWESEAPAASVRWATPYVHNVPDCFCLTGFYAFNRPLYINRQCSPGYAGTDPTWSNSISSHSGVIVDYLEPRAVGVIPLRFSFAPLAKFVSGRAQDVYPGVDQTRALVLTREYLFDVFQLRSATPRSYLWQIQAIGQACPDNPAEWAATRRLIAAAPDLQFERSCVMGDRPWAVTVYQTTGGADPQSGAVGPKWFRERIGVRMWMFGEPGTVAYTAGAPCLACTRDRFRYGADEPGGQTLAAERCAPETAFVALHEPFKESRRIAEVRRIAQDAQAVAAAVIGGPNTEINDRVMVRYGEGRQEAAPLSGNGEVFMFSDFAFMRLWADRIRASGGLSACRVYHPAAGAGLRFVLNGKEQPVQVRDGYVLFGAAALPEAALKAAGTPPASSRALPAGPLAARFRPETVCLPTAGKGVTALRLRNLGFQPLTGEVRLRPEPGVTVSPGVISVKDLVPGDEQEIAIELTGDAKAANSVRTLSLERVAPADAARFEVQPAELRLAQGVAQERGHFWPRDKTVTIYAPRYVAKYFPLDSCGAAGLFDPLGMRRHDVRDAVYPRLRVLRAGAAAKADAKAKTPWVDERLTALLYWNPVSRKDSASGAGCLAESGTHPHFPEGVPLEYRWTEDWIVAWYRWEAEQVEMDWTATWRPDVLAPGPELPFKYLVHTGQKIEDGTTTKATALRAILRRPPGSPYGEATFYPASAKVLAQDKKTGLLHVGFAAGEPMAFTYCTEEEFAGLAEKWIKGPPPPRAHERGQGDTE